MTTQGMNDSMICGLKSLQQCGLISLTFVDSEVRTARMTQVWKCRLAQSRAVW